MSNRSKAWMSMLALAAVLGSTPLMTTQTAYAQDAVTDLARAKFLEGVKAYDAGRYDEARGLFLQAYALKRHPAVLLNLGQSELKSGYIEDGGNHLQQFLREHKTATDAQKQAAKKGIGEAQKRTGFAVIIADADGAQIAIDGQAVGTSPLLDPVFVKPGKHTATANMNGKTVAAVFTAKRASAVPVTLTLGMPSAAPKPVPPAPVPPTPVPVQPVPTPTPVPAAPVPGPVPAPVPMPAPVPYPQPGMGGPMPQPGMGVMPMPPPDGGVRPTGRPNFFKWFTQKPIAWVGAGLTGVGVIGAISFGAAAGVANGKVSGNSDDILAEVARTDNLPDEYYTTGDRTTGQAQPCGQFDSPSTAHPYYADACNTLRDNIDSRDGSLIGVAVFTSVAVAAAAGTVIYYFVDTADGGGSAQSEQTGPKFGVVPMITPNEGGIGIVGSF